MPLDAQAQAIADSMSAWPAPDFETLSAADYRAMLAGMAPLPTPDDPLAAVTDGELPGPAGPLAIRTYRPTAESGLPLTVFFHGGGFVSCGIDSHDNICRRLAALAGTLVVSVAYRLAPESRFPAAVHDALMAVRWLHANAASLGADPQRLAVAGDSAGGNLAAVVARELPDLVRHQLLIYPVTDLTGEQPSRVEFAQGPMLTQAMMRWFSAQYLPTAQAAQNPWASPLARNASGSVPAATIITAECDPLRDEGEAYARLLTAAGTPVVLRRWPGQFHGFASLSGILDAADRALEFAATSLRQALLPPGEHPAGFRLD